MLAVKAVGGTRFVTTVVHPESAPAAGPARVRDSMDSSRSVSFSTDDIGSAEKGLERAILTEPAMHSSFCTLHRCPGGSRCSCLGLGTGPPIGSASFRSGRRMGILVTWPRKAVSALVGVGIRSSPLVGRRFCLSRLVFGDRSVISGWQRVVGVSSERATRKPASHPATEQVSRHRHHDVLH